MSFIMLCRAIITSCATFFVLFAGESKPNFVIILADDMGWTDLACYGSDLYRTPHIDALSSQGMHFTNAYAACCVCSPTRASIYTGQYPARLHLTDYIPGQKKPEAKLLIPNWVQTISPKATTIPKELAKLGYISGVFGKWHLKSKPAELGFNVAVEIEDKAKNTNDPKNVLSITNQSIDFITKNREKPFFCVVAHNAVHMPIVGKPEVVSTYEAQAKLATNHKDPNFAAMVEALDGGVGQLLKAITDLDLDNNTVVIFLSDNGGLLPATNNAPLRGGKGMQYEGGIRVPAMVRWPGHIAANSINTTRISSIDLLPTIVSVAKGAKPSALVDGVDLSPLWTGTGTIQREALFWHYPHYHQGMPGGSIIQGNMKLINFFEDNTFELYDLAQDPGETRNLAEQRPQVVIELRKKLEAWRMTVDAQMMLPNPAYDPDKDRNDKKSKKKGEEKSKN
jgi:arylsulfatase A